MPAQRMLNEALEIQRRLNNQRPLGYVVFQLAEVAWLEGDLVRARTLHTEALTLRTKLGEKGTAAESRLALALIELEEARAAQAQALAREAYVVFEGQKATDNQAGAQAVLARALFAQGQRGAAMHEGQRARALVRTSTNALGRIPVFITASWLEGVAGPAAHAMRATAALRELQGQARQYGMARYELDAGLALAQIEARASRDSARARLASLEKDARARGLGLYVKRATMNRPAD